MKKILLGILGLLLLATTLVGIYGYKLHTLAVERVRIFSLRCTQVNPHLIAYKKSFLSFADYLKHHQRYKPEEGMRFFDDYIAEMRNYVMEENAWLAEEDKYASSREFQLLESWYIKQAEAYQWKMYEAYRDHATAQLGIIDRRESDIGKTVEARDRIDKYSKLYFDFSDEAGKINDIRKFFGNVSPSSECNERNMDIPDTSGSLDQEASPSAIPGDPELVI